jgi:hypothetical protein
VNLREQPQAGHQHKAHLDLVILAVRQQLAGMAAAAAEAVRVEPA